MTRRDQWLVYGLFALILFIGAAFLVAVLRQEVPESSRGAARPVDPNPGNRVEQTRKELVAQLIAAIQKTAKENDPAQMSELSDTLARQGEPAVPPVLETLGQDHSWNVRIALLGVLERIRSVSVVKGLEKFYGALTAAESALKLDVIRRLGRIGGGETRRALLGMLAREKDEKARGEIAKSLIALGIQPEEVAKLQEQDRVLLEKDARRNQEIRERIEKVEKADPSTPEGMRVIKEHALGESTVAVALEAFKKLEARNDAVATAVLVERSKGKGETNDEKIIQTNALATLARMTSAEARVAVREIALGENADLRLQAVEFVGGFGDRAMLPLLDQAVKKDASDRMAKAVERAKVSIESRARAQEKK